MPTTKGKLPRLSPSRINTFDGCPMKYRFQYIESVPTLPSKAMVRGSFVHRVLELLLARARDQRTIEAARDDFDTAQREFRLRDDWRMLALDATVEESFWESSRECVRSYYRIERPADANIVHLEKRMAAPLGEFEVAGIVDRLERDNEGLVVSDYKTSTPKSAQHSTDNFRQLTYYAMMCEVQMNETPHSVRVYYLGGGKDEYPRDKRVVSEVVTADSIAKVRETARRVYGAIEAGKSTGDFATKVTKLCGWCDYRKWCPAYGGDIAKAKAEATVMVQLRRREVGLPDSA